MTSDRFAWTGRMVPLAALLLTGCASAPDRTISTTPVSAAEPVASLADPSGRMQGYQLAHTYEDVVRIDGRSVRQNVEHGFDYARAVPVRRIYDATTGELMSEETQFADSLRANAAEQVRLNELVRTHPVLGPMMQQPDLLVHAGGFVFREPGDPYCDRGSRCLRFIVSRGDGSIRHLHAIVDLVSDRVVYPFVDDVSPAPAGKESKP